MVWFLRAKLPKTQFRRNEKQEGLPFLCDSKKKTSEVSSRNERKDSTHPIQNLPFQGSTFFNQGKAQEKKHQIQCMHGNCFQQLKFMVQHFVKPHVGTVKHHQTSEQKKQQEQRGLKSNPNKSANLTDRINVRTTTSLPIPSDFPSSFRSRSIQTILDEPKVLAAIIHPIHAVNHGFPCRCCRCFGGCRIW